MKRKNEIGTNLVDEKEIITLPDDVLKLIFFSLEPIHLKNCLFVCHQWEFVLKNAQNLGWVLAASDSFYELRSKSNKMQQQALLSDFPPFFIVPSCNYISYDECWDIIDEKKELVTKVRRIGNGIIKN